MCSRAEVLVIQDNIKREIPHAGIPRLGNPRNDSIKHVLAPNLSYKLSVTVILSQHNWYVRQILIKLPNIKFN